MMKQKINRRNIMDKVLVEKVNGYIANIAVSYIKLHNLHWNVIGPDFKPVHEYLETLYDAMAEVLDESAELLKINGQVPLASMQDYLKVAIVKELESKDYSTKEALAIVLADMQLLKAQASELRALANEQDQFDIANLAEDNLANYNKTIWFLSVMNK